MAIPQPRGPGLARGLEWRDHPGRIRRRGGTMIAYFNRNTEWDDAVGLTFEIGDHVGFRPHKNGQFGEESRMPAVSFHDRYRMIMFEDFDKQRVFLMEIIAKQIALKIAKEMAEELAIVD
jgi:hypothetical protein